MLTVRYGSFAALERAFLDELVALKSADPLARVAVVCPSRRLAERLERLVALEAGRTVLELQAHTFYSLARAVVADHPEGSRPVLGDPLFFEKLLDELLGGAPRGAPRGLAAAYRASLKDLIDAGVEPRAEELLDEGLLKDPAQAGRLRELLRLLGRYERRLAELDVLPPAALTRLAAERAGESLYLQGFSRLFYYGFYDLTGLQAEFFEAVHRDHAVTLFFPYRKGKPAFAFADRFFDSRLHRGGRPPQPLPEPGPAELGPAGAALAEAADRLFLPGGGAPRPGGAAASGPDAGRALRLFNVSGCRDEAWRTAKEILRLVEREGFAFSEIGVVARSLEPYRAAVVEAFRESAVPFHTPALEPLLREPAARAVRILLTLARRDFPALAVLDLAASPHFLVEPGPHWAELVRRLRIHRGWLQWEGRLYPASRRDFELAPRLAYEGQGGRVVPAAESARLWELLCELRAGLGVPGSRPWSRWAAHARHLVERYLRPGGRGLAEALDALDSLGALDRLGREVGWEEFLETAEERLEGAGLAVCAEPGRGVRVLGAMDARGESFRVLFLLGLQEGLFPRAVREDPILSEAARLALRDVGGYGLAPKQAGYDEERLLFALLAASARERLYCSWPRSDEEGRACVPSIYLLELCRAVGAGADVAAAEHVPRQPAERLSDPGLAPFLSPKEASLAAALAGADPGPLYRALGWDAEGFRRLAGRVAELNRAGPAGRMDGVVGEPADFLAGLARRGLSPSALESLSRCPFQFFASRLLELGEPDEPAPAGELSPRLRGEICHRVLALFHAQLGRSGWWERRGAFPAAVLEEALAEGFAGLGWRELGVYPLLWEIAAETLRGDLAGFLAGDLERLAADGLRPGSLEAELSAELRNAPPELGGLLFHGIVDRIDVGPAGWRVVDYKSSLRGEPLARRVQKGRNWQAPLYLELAGRSQEGRSLGARFCALQGAADGEPAAQEWSAEAHAAHRPALLAELGRLVGELRRGRFPIRPEEGRGGHCGWCSFGGVCRKGHPMSRVRALASRSEAGRGAADQEVRSGRALASRPEAGRGAADQDVRSGRARFGGTGDHAGR